MRRHVAIGLALLAVPTLPSVVPPMEDAPIAQAPRVDPGPAPSSSGSRAVSRSPWLDGRWLVAPSEGTNLSGLAAKVGGEVLAPIGRSGYGVIGGGPEVAGKLAAAGARLVPEGRVVGAGRRKGGGTPPALPSWHLSAIDLPSSPDARIGEYLVAVLDTGLAYEDRAPFAQVPGMAGVPIVAPADFVELDGHPNDDHQHGTHIASLIASRGQLKGVATGVGLMPIKVLDAHNVGTEWALVEGLWHAVDEGADVINLSLSFPLGYLPSPALEEALTHALDEGVVIVAASGNEGRPELTWPAAARGVVAVGAARSDFRTTASDGTPYSDLGPALAVLAPGGSFELDADRDGWPDGVLAETIDPSRPTRYGFWFYEGTSQAAALVSGAAVHLLAAGIDPEDVGPALQQSTSGGYSSTDALLQGNGGGVLDVSASLSDGDREQEDVFVGLLPFVRPGMDGHDPRARVTVVDDGGEPLGQVDVLATVYSESSVDWASCRTAGDGTCELRGEADSASDAWMFRVDAVVLGGVGQRPARAAFTSDGGAVLLGALEDQGGWDALAVYWPAAADAALGQLEEAWAVTDLGVSPLSGPTALVFLPSHVDGLAEDGTLELDLDGTGLLSSPMGGLTLKTLTLNGSGLLSSPMGGLSIRLVGLTGSSSTGFSFEPTDLYAPTGTGLLSSPMGLGWYGEALLLDRGTLLGCGEGSWGFDALAGDEGGEPAATLVGAGAVEVGVSFAPATATASSAATPLRY